MKWIQVVAAPISLTWFIGSLSALGRIATIYYLDHNYSSLNKEGNNYDFFSSNRTNIYALE